MNLSLSAVRWIVVSVLGILAVNVSKADDFTWAASPASGNWNTADINWTGAGSIWTNGAANNATFGASDTKSITADAVTLTNLSFTADDGRGAYGGFRTQRNPEGFSHLQWVWPVWLRLPLSC